MIEVTELEWDSNFFGFPVAKVDLQNQLPDASRLLDLITNNGCRLCYIFTHDEDGDVIAVATGASLVDRRTLLQHTLSRDNVMTMPGGTQGIANLSDLPRVRALALQSAKYSRFRIDPAMPSQAWVRLYETWADNSLKGSMADAVLVERIGGIISGMVTVSCRNGEGVIGLLAVDESARGRGLGTTLLQRGADWFLNRGCHTASVVTQGDNDVAMRLYQRAGYVVANVTSVSHLWLPKRGKNDLVLP